MFLSDKMRICFLNEVKKKSETESAEDFMKI